jgi:hypothetical protein
VKKDDLEEMKTRIIRLTSDSDLQALISKIHKLINELNTNERRNDFFVKIDALYEWIYMKGKLLNEKGRCNACPAKSWLNYF